MTEWETIFDKSSHISPVKLVPPKNYSVERGDGIFEAVSIQKSHFRSKAYRARKRHFFRMKTIILKMILFALIGSAFIAGLWTCNKEEYSAHSLCVYTKQLRAPYTLYIKGFDYHCLEQWMDRTKNYCYQITAPYTTKLKAGYQWSEKTNVKTALKQLGSALRSLFYTADDQLRLLRFLNRLVDRYITIPWSWVKEATDLQCKKWLFQLEDYVNSPSSTRKMPEQVPQKQDFVVEDKLKKTAKRILDYIDQLNQESIQTGMKQEEAKEKAQEIIKSITESTTTQEIVLEFDTVDSDAVVAAFEIQSIMETALQEKLRLEDQLDLILSRVRVLSLEEAPNEDTDLFISALKTEIDQLRVAAEKSVRERTEVGLKHVEKLKSNTLVAAHMKKDLQSAQKAALKELRQAYAKLYQTNKEIDNIMHF